MELKEKIFAVLIFVGGIILALFIYSLFTKKKELPDRSGEIKALELLIQSEKEKVAIYRTWKDDLNEKLQEKDSLLQIKEKTIITKYEKIPVTVANYSDAELRSAVESFR